MYFKFFLVCLTIYSLNDTFQFKKKIIPETGNEIVYSDNKTLTVYKILIKDHTEDQTLNIQSQIDTIPNGTLQRPNIILFPNVCIWTEGNLKNNPRGRNGIIRLENRHNLILEGGMFYTKAPAVSYGSSVRKGEHSLRRHFWIINSSNITLKNIRVEGSNYTDGKLIGTTPETTPDFWPEGSRSKGTQPGFPAYRSYWEQEHAFDIRGSHNITIENCESFATWGDGIYVGADGNEVSTNIVLRNNHLRFTGRQGIAAANNVDGLLIENNWIDFGRRAAIDLEPHTHGGFVKNVIVKKNRLFTQNVAVAALGRGMINDIQILDNEFSGGNFLIAGDSYQDNQTNNWTIKDNNRVGSFGSPAASVKIHMTDNIIFEGNNDAIRKQSRNTISFWNCGGELIVKNNDFHQGEYILDLGGNSEIVKEGNTPLQIIKEL